MSEGPRAWIVIEGEEPPAGWADRATEAWVVRLVPEEVSGMLTNKTTQPVLGGGELRLARLVAEGQTSREIALELGVDHRTVQRQIARLRMKFGVRSKGELTSVLAEAGL